MIFTIGMVAFLIAALLRYLFGDPLALLVNPRNRTVMFWAFVVGVVGIATMAVSLGMLAWRHLP